jgi:hypothetical protein
MKKVMAAEEAKAAEDMASFWAALEGDLISKNWTI